MSSIRAWLMMVRHRLWEAGWTSDEPIRVLSWEGLRSLGNSRLISTSFLWIVAIPWAARVLVWWNDVVAPAERLSLPRNMRFIYLMSLCFVVAQGLYWWRCPAFLKHFGTFARYEAVHGRETARLSLLVCEMLRHLDDWHRRQAFEATCKDLGVKRPERVPDTSSARYEDWEAHVYGDIRDGMNRALAGNQLFGVTEAVNRIARFADQSRMRSIKACTVLFSTGLVLFAIAAIENLVAVVRVTQWW